METTKMIGRIVAGAYYNYQQIRISTNNRIRDIVRKKIDGIGFDEVEKKKGKKDFKKRFTDKQLTEFWKKLMDDKKVSEKEYNYVLKCLDISKESEKIENKYKKTMLEYIGTEPVYNEFLSKIRGIGPVLSANLLKEFGDCSRYEKISNLWSHTGNHVVGGKAPKKRKGEDLTFSPRLRTMTWKISDCLMKLNKGIYRNIYDTEKQRQLSIKHKEGELFKKFGKPYKEKDTELKLGHAHNRALRKMRKLFLANYWEASRELNGLEVTEPYSKDKLGHTNIISWRKAVEIEMQNKMP